MHKKDQSEEVFIKIKQEMNKLENKLKERLESAQDIRDLEDKVNKNTFKLEKTSSGLERESRTANWSLMFELYKYYLLIGIGAFIILYILYKSIFK